MKPTPAALARTAAIARARMEVTLCGHGIRLHSQPRRLSGSRGRRKGHCHHRENSCDDVGPAPAERDRDRGQSDTGEQCADRGAGLLGAEGQPVPAGLNRAPQQGADGGAADRIADARDQQDRDQRRRRFGERRNGEAGSGGQGGAEQHPAARPDPLDEVPRGGREDHAGHVEAGDSQTQGGVAEGEVVTDPRGEARGQEAWEHAGDDQGRAGDDRSAAAVRATHQRRRADAAARRRPRTPGRAATPPR